MGEQGPKPYSLYTPFPKIFIFWFVFNVLGIDMIKYENN